MALAQRGFDSATEEEQHTLVQVRGGGELLWCVSITLCSARSHACSPTRQDFNTRAVKILDIACQRRGCVTREEFEAALEAHRDNKRVQQLVEYREQLIEAMYAHRMLACGCAVVLHASGLALTQRWLATWPQQLE